VIEARDGKADPIAAVESRIGWEKFVRSVAEAESLARPETTDNRAELIEKYGTIRTFAPVLLEAFKFRGGDAVNGLLAPRDHAHSRHVSGGQARAAGHTADWVRSLGVASLRVQGPRN
jgi:hypothetical protein